MSSAPVTADTRRWRDYATPQGNRPVRDYLARLDDRDMAKVVAAMRDVAEHGTRVARHVRGEIYEVRAHGDRAAYRILFAEEGRYGQILLALEAFGKTTRRTPPQTVELAETRLADWRMRGRLR